MYVRNLVKPAQGMQNADINDNDEACDEGENENRNDEGDGDPVDTDEEVAYESRHRYGA